MNKNSFLCIFRSLDTLSLEACCKNTPVVRISFAKSIKNANATTVWQRKVVFLYQQGAKELLAKKHAYVDMLCT